MSVAWDSERLSLSGHCTVEEAETVLTWILQHPQGEIDLSALEHMHMSIFQVLLAAGASQVRLPEDPFWQQLWGSIVTAMESDDRENRTRSG
jgi:hypothetical protein